MAEFGVRLPAGGPLASPGAMARVARRSEALGYDAVWVHDFIVWTKLQERTHVSCGSVEAIEASGDDPPIFYESITNLAWLAGITERVRLGVAVLCIPYREPIATAKQIANLDLLSHGRLILGVGVGGAKTGNNQDFEILGVPRSDKWARTTEYVNVMKEIWTGERPSFTGQYVSFPPTDINPKPVQKPYPPIWGSGRLDKSMRVTAEVADGWLPSWIPADEYAAKAEELQQMTREAGRDVEMTIGNEVYACIAPTSQEARRKSERTIEVLHHGFGSNPPVELISRASLVGSPAEVLDRVGAFVAAGVSHFELKFIYHDIDDLLQQLQLFQEEVMPALTGREGAIDGAAAIR